MRSLILCGVGLAILACGGSAPGPREPAPSVESPSASASSANTRSEASGHLRVQDGRFVRPDGRPFAWRGISAFRLLEQVAHEREAEAVAYLDWARARELTVVRVFSMAHHLFTLDPEEGARALPKLLELAAARNLYVEIVALADTVAIPVDIRAHVERIGRIAAAHPNAILEVANEPVHPTQRPEVHRAERLREAAETIPAGVPVSLGSIERGSGFGAGSYLTWHVPRETEPGGWGHVLAIAAGAALTAKWRKPVVSDEPIGAAAEFRAGRRDNDPNRFRAAALVTRLAGLGATFHYEGGLQARVPTGVERECFDAWSDAWRLLPPEVERQGAFIPAGEQGSAVAGHRPDAAAAVYVRQAQTIAWVAAVKVERELELRPASGWRATRTERFPGVQVWTLERN